LDTSVGFAVVEGSMENAWMAAWAAYLLNVTIGGEFPISCWHLEDVRCILDNFIAVAGRVHCQSLTQVLEETRDQVCSIGSIQADPLINDDRIRSYLPAACVRFFYNGTEYAALLFDVNVMREDWMNQVLAHIADRLILDLSPSTVDFRLKEELPGAATYANVTFTRVYGCWGAALWGNQKTRKQVSAHAAFILHCLRTGVDNIPYVDQCFRKQLLSASAKLCETWGICITQTVDCGTTSVAHDLAEKPYTLRRVKTTATVRQTCSTRADLGFLRQFGRNNVESALCPFWQDTIRDVPKIGSLVGGPSSLSR
jgi:hypothetical protein